MRPRLPLAGRSAAARKRSGTKALLGLTSYLWILPAVAFVVAIVYYSVGYTVVVSTLDWDGISPERTSVGFDNYVRVFHDPIFWLAMKHMLIFSVTIVLQIVLGALAAVLLHSRVRLAAVYKTLLFVPVIIAPAVMAPIFRQMFDADGQLNQLLRNIGLGALAHPWLADPATALYVLMAITVWQWTGFSFLLYYASLGQLDPHVLEAARIDGAGNWRIVFNIIVPLSRGTTLTLLILGVIGTLRTFDIPYLISGGGPARTTEFLSTYLYEQGISNSHAGYGAALTVVLMALALMLTIPQVRRYREAGAGS